MASSSSSSSSSSTTFGAATFFGGAASRGSLFNLAAWVQGGAAPPTRDPLTVLEATETSAATARDYRRTGLTGIGLGMVVASAAPAAAPPPPPPP